MNGSCVVTGAAKGLGRATAEVLVAEGWQVVGLDVDEAALATAAREVGFEPLTGSIVDWAALERAAALAGDRAPLLGWVNNAAVDLQGGAHEVDREHVARGIETLCQGPLYGIAVAVQAMLPLRRGSIVTISSIQAVAAFPRYFVYGAAKAALVQATRSVAVDYGPFGLRCNTVLPGTIDTPMLDEVLPPDVPRAEAVRREGELSPLGRVADPVEVARVVAFLLSDAASYVSGAAITVDGATTARAYPYPSLDL